MDSTIAAMQKTYRLLFLIWMNACDVCGAQLRRKPRAGGITRVQEATGVSRSCITAGDGSGAPRSLRARSVSPEEDASVTEHDLALLRCA